MIEFFALKNIIYVLYFILLLCPFGIPILLVSGYIAKNIFNKENVYVDQNNNGFRDQS